MGKPPERNSSQSQRSRGFPDHAYEQLIRYATDYGNAFGFSSSATQKTCRAAETMYLVIRVTKGDVRLRLRMLTRELGAEPRALGECFRKLYGMTPKASQIQVRIEWVRHTISTQPTLKLESIAAGAGYKDVADFNHIFRKHVGMSPRQYQKDCQKHSSQFDK